jgi:spore coat protein A
MGASAAIALPWGRNASADSQLKKFVQKVPLPGDGIVVATPQSGSLAFTQTEIARQLHPDLPPTPLWAYVGVPGQGTFTGSQAGSFGMAVIAQSGTPLQVSFTHNLPSHYPSRLPVDTRLTLNHDDVVRVMTHLHGGFVSADSDGNPQQTPNQFTQGQTQTVFYTNQQPQMPASLLWFHDHGLGTTRLNVFAGLAAAYILRDQFDTGQEPNPIGIPGGRYEIPLVVQDRQINADGTLLYPTSTIPGATWIGEYFGDVMLVNGKVWPFLEVEPRLYRLRILNGCNARILNLDIPGTNMVQIGAEGGLWDAPVPVNSLVLAPAERADVIVDFSPFRGQRVLLSNHQPPKPVSTPAPPLTQVMQFRVGTTVTNRGPTSIPTSLPGRAANLSNPAKTRFITLNEIAPNTAAWHLNLNAIPFQQAPGPNDMPVVGTVEDWVYINLTGDTHPMHTHLVTMQVIGRTPFDADAYQAAYADPTGGVPGGIDPTPFATGPMAPAEETERGFKDTVRVNPGFFTTVRAKYDLPEGVTAPQTYVYHCHILEHEDNDMMRPFTVIP